MVGDVLDVEKLLQTDRVHRLAGTVVPHTTKPRAVADLRAILKAAFTR